MAEFRNGSEWVGANGLDPELAKLDSEQFMVSWQDKLRALGDMTLTLLQRAGLQYVPNGVWVAPLPPQNKDHKQ